MLVVAKRPSQLPKISLIRLLGTTYATTEHHSYSRAGCKFIAFKITGNVINYASELHHVPAREQAPTMSDKSRLPQPIDLEIGRRIRVARDAAGVATPHLASTIGVTVQQLERYESGASRLSVKRLGQVATALGLPLAAFFGGPADGAAAKPGDALDALRLLRAFQAIVSAEHRADVLALAELHAASAIGTRGASHHDA